MKKFESELGIKVMCLHGPYYCEKCDQLVTEKTCPHKETSPESCFEISGTFVRDNIKNNSPLSEKYLRKEVIEALSNFNPFIE